jgi:hypothetical protein
MLNDDFESFKEINKYETPDPLIVQTIMDEAIFCIKNYGKKRTPHVLIIFDDVADNAIIQFHSIVDTLAVRGRHMNISVIVASQRLRSISPVIRINTDHCFLFAPYSFAEIQKFVEEFVAKQRRPMLFKKLEDIYNEKHSFLLLDNSEYLQKNKLKQVKDGKLTVINLDETMKPKDIEQKDAKPVDETRSKDVEGSKEVDT